MFRTLHDFVAVLTSVACFFPFFVAPGYLVAFLTNLNGFRSRSAPERVLWAVSLSTPLSILLTVFTGRHFSSNLTTSVIFLLFGVWVALLFWEHAQGRLIRCEEWNRPARIALVIASLLSLYCVLATLGVTVGHKLYEGTYAGDWSVRVPLTAAALHAGVPIITPFYGIAGESLSLRYYYYWYVLCGAVGRIAHSSGRSALASSCVWSALSLFSILLLFMKWLFGPAREKSGSMDAAVSLRWMCVLMFPVSCILGLDILPSVLSVMMRPIRLFPEMEWWRSEGDFSLSFHTAILYAPHHTAGLTCCMLGFLLLTLCASKSGQPASQWKNVLVYAILASSCFAAAIGTSTYLTLIFSIACVLLAMERSLRRDWKVVAAIAITGMIALPLSSTYIHEILAGAGASLHRSDPHASHARFIALALRNVGLPRVQLLQLGGNLLHYNQPAPRWIKLVLRPTMTFLLFVVELGFFGFVLAWRVWADLRKPSLLTDLQRMQWVLFVALAFAALCLTSQPVIGVNDLGRHAGFGLRFVAVLWATPLLVRARYDTHWVLSRHRGLQRVVYVTLVLGLCSQIWQIVVQRSYPWLVDRGFVIYPFAPFPRFPHYGTRYFETREAFEAMNRVVPPNGRVQFNPTSTYWSLMSDYLERPVAAFDADCEAAFGGDLEQCHAAIPSIRGLFGGGRPVGGIVQDFDSSLITANAFVAVCREQHLQALVVSASDRVWPEKTSWLWTRPAVFTNASMRVVACPAVSP